MKRIDTVRAGLLLPALLLATPAVPAGAGPHYVAVDVPARLGAVELLTNQLALDAAGLYSIEATLPEGADVGALHRRPDGIWLLAFAQPVSLGGAFRESRDVVAFDGSSWATWLDGSDAGLPSDARIDALFVDSGGAAVFSLDTPAIILGTWYGAFDLIQFDGASYTRYFNAAAAGVPPEADLVGADLDGAGALVLTFDVPVTLGAADYLPGELIRWTGSGFAGYGIDPSWPSYARLRDFAFVPAAGAVPDGSILSDSPLDLAMTAESLTLSWGPSCAAGDDDYEVYEGILGLFYSHTPRLCSTGGATSVTFPPPAGSVYYLVVPRNALREGSYGPGSDGSERPRRAGACLPQEILAVCR